MKNYYYCYCYWYIFGWWYQNFSLRKFATGGALLLPDLDSIHSGCATNLMLTKLKSSILQGKLMQLNLLTNFVITHTDSIKDLEVHFGTTFFFQSLKMWDSYIYMGAERDFLCTRVGELSNWKCEPCVTALLFAVPTWWTMLAFSSSVSRYKS